jgi:hypothetical protein
MNCGVGKTTAVDVTPSCHRPIIPDTLRSFGVFLGKSGLAGFMADQETLLEIEPCLEMTPNIRAVHRRHAEPIDGPAKFATAARMSPGPSHELKPFHLASRHPACSVDILGVVPLRPGLCA